MNGRLSRVVRALLAVGLLIAVGFLPTTAGGPADAAPAGSAISATKTVTRTNLAADGSSQTVASRTVKVDVSATKQLYGREDVNVTWSGAQPTGGLQPDINGAFADQQEYPMALLECRGVDSSAAPAATQVSPETCWTHGPDERYQGVSYANYAPWRLDRYASAGDRDAVVGRPASAEAECGDPATNERWTPFRAADGTNYYYGNQSCAGIPPEDFNADTSQQVVPQNATFAATAADGTGSAKFDVWTDAQNQSLGCSAAVSCTLEIIPIMGISCDPYGVSPAAHNLPADDIPGPDDQARATRDCEAGGAFSPGQINTGSASPNLAVTGALWWSSSNWRNRIAVPLTFAPVSKACEQVGGGSPVSVYGSELLADATNQWAPSFCLNPKLFKFTHVQTGEPLAQSLLDDPTSGVGAAFASTPPSGGFARPVVQAPVAVSGFSISFNIDDAHGNAVTTLRLNARLLAKLLTESYPGDDFDRFATGQYPYLKGNPINITYDPEFQALNPGIAEELNGTAGPAALIALPSQSDVVQALTSYLNADPEARAWLNGKPDPWGMVVNPAYKGISLPVLQWPLRDTTLPDFGAQVACTSSDPAPWLPLVASPTATLATSRLDVQFAASPGRVTCTPIGDPNNPANVSYQWSSLGRQQPGLRFVIGVTTVGDAARYDLSSALLQTSSSVGDGKFSSAAGRTFVGPTQAAMSAAAARLTPDPDSGTWKLPYGKLANTPAAYPGTMLVSADVLTSGLTADVAKDYAELLTFAAGPGQVVGTGNGQLPAGYVPVTAAHHLAGLAAYTRVAATAVREQKGAVPPLSPSSSPSGSSSGGPAGSRGSSGSAPIGGAVVGGPGIASGPAAARTAAGQAAAVRAAAGSRSSSAAAPGLAAQTFRTPTSSLGIGGVVLPLIFGVGVLGSLLAGAAVWTPQRAGRKHRRAR